MIRQLIEGQLTWLPALTLSDLPHPLPSGIRIHARRDELGLEVHGLVGSIPLLNGDTLQIIPKIGRVNFLRLLFRAEGTQQDLEREYEDFVEYSVEDDHNVDSVAARHLLISSAAILTRSPQQGRVKRKREGLFAVGQIDAVATALNIACHRREPVAYYVSEKTVNIPENRLITEAIIRAWPMLAEPDRDDLRWIHDRWLDRFPRSDDLDSDLYHTEQSFAAARYGGPRDYYRRVLMLAQIVLGNSGLGFSEAATILGDAVLLNTSHIFEKYLRNVISSAYSEAGYVVTKGGIGVSSLYTNGTFELEPDIVVTRDGHTLLVADAKYKHPTAGDHYQMHAYLGSHGDKRGLLLAPLLYGDEVVFREYSTADKTVVREAYLPMSNLTATEAFLATVVERFT